MNVFLIGFMGCGKSTIGRKLAHKLNYDFIDLDKTIESKAEMTIAAYFEAYGENAFRQFEKEVLQGFSYPENSIVATGGGAPCFFDNMRWMNQHGITAYISLTPKSLSDRLASGQAERPLIRNLNKEELVDFIAIKLAERESYYTQAQFIINGIDCTSEKVIEQLNLR